MPKPLSRQSKQLVASLITYFERERDNNGPLLPLNAVRERVANALQLNVKTVSKISQTVKSNSLLHSPKRKKPRQKPVFDVSEGVQVAIRDTVYLMYKNKQHITLRTLLSFLKERDIFDGCQESLRKVLKSIGFRWNKNDSRRGLMELDHVANIECDVSLLKIQLLELVSLNKPPKKFIVDTLAEQYGHRVLRLPPYHCIFNPIENVWGMAKRYYNDHIGRDGGGMEKAVDMWKEALSTVTPQKWKNSFDHAEKEIKSWWEREKIFDTHDIAPIIIHLSTDSDSSESEYDSDET